MRRYPVILFLIIILIAAGCGAERKFSSSFFAMGNIPIHITIYSDTIINADSVFNVLEDSIQTLDSLFSKYNPNSPVYKFNNEELPIFPNKHIQRLMEVSDSVNRETAGLFDIRIEMVIEYYKRCEAAQKDPDTDSIAYLVKRMNAGRVYMMDGFVIKSDPKAMIDFGGIAKGYMGDIIRAVLLDSGIKRAVIDMGGDDMLLNKKNSKPFKVGITSAVGDSLYTVIEVADGAAVTSGDYYRFYEINGKKYCHIINPLTGLPADNINSVTVVHGEGIYADAFATALMLMDSMQIAEFEKQHPELEIIIQK